MGVGEGVGVNGGEWTQEPPQNPKPVLNYRVKLAFVKLIHFQTEESPASGSAQILLI